MLHLIYMFTHIIISAAQIFLSVARDFPAGFKRGKTLKIVLKTLICGITGAAKNIKIILA
jgi:hypothetical protein